MAGIFVGKDFFFFSGNQPFLWKPSINLNLFFMCRYSLRLTSFSSILRTFLFLITNFLKKVNNALEAAIEMQQAVREINRQQDIFPVQIGIGMHTCPLIMGITGDEDRLDACTISDTVNTASRLESLTKHFKADILISENSLQQINDKGKFNFRGLGLIQLKGKQKNIQVLECYNSNSPEMIRCKLKTLVDFNEGILNYIHQDFKTALEAFKKVTELSPDDRLHIFS